ncbi:unnamed protein product [Phytomonas sp. EM1]|nr:unnamed protein product [Phytomonas sp. EM1]|eukprot:CCW60365.1 unnamed protein product [Phytomonas sp. isolate EM1]
MDEIVRQRVKQRRLEEERVGYAVIGRFLANAVPTSFPADYLSKVGAREQGNANCVFSVPGNDRDGAYRYRGTIQADFEFNKALHKVHMSRLTPSGTSENSLCGQLDYVLHKLPNLLRDTVLCSHDCSGLNLPFSALVLDIETTGLSPNIDQIIELGCVELRWNGCGVCTKDVIPEGCLTGQWVRGSRTFHRLVRPTVAVTRAAAAVHSLSDETLRRASCWRDVSKELRDFCGSLQAPYTEAPNSLTSHRRGDGDAARDSFILPPLIAHNAQFDGAFLEKCLMRLGYRVLWHPLYPITCTERLSRQLYPKYASNLDQVSIYLGVSGAIQRMQSSHSAYRDAIQCAKVFLRLAQDISVHQCEKPTKR